MALRTIESAPMTILDLTDNRQVVVTITSDTGTVQIYDPATGMYIPSWAAYPVTLTAKVVVNGAVKTDSIHYTWKRRINNQAEVEVGGNSPTYKIMDNVIEATNVSIVYSCHITYQGLEGYDTIAFVRVKNGENGEKAPNVKAQYSVTGTGGWSTTLLPSQHKYVRFSYDDGLTWTEGVRFVGGDGTSVEIQSDAYYNGTVTDALVGQSVTLYKDAAHTTVLPTAGLDTGAGFLAQGYLFVFTGAANKFTCAGRIRGPAGLNGQSTYTFIRYAKSAAGEDMSADPTGRNYIGFCLTTANVAPTTPASYVWSKFVGGEPAYIELRPSATAFKVNETTCVPSSIIIDAIGNNVTPYYWAFSEDGKTWKDTLPYITVNGMAAAINGAAMTNDIVTVKVSDLTYAHTTSVTICKLSDGQSAPGAADYVIEEDQETQGMITWNWRKWNSGRLEQWAALLTNSGTMEQKGAAYVGVNSITGVYPIQFATDDVFVQASIRVHDSTEAILYTTGEQTKRYTPTYQLMQVIRHGTPHNFTVDVFAVGRWKV